MASVSNPSPVPTGAAIRAARIGARMSLRDLSAALGGKPGFQHLGRVESGERDLSPVLADRIADAIGDHLGALAHGGPPT